MDEAEVHNAGRQEASPRSLRSGKREARRWPDAVILLGLVWASLAIAEVPAIQCKAVSAGGRILVDPALRSFLDRDLQRLIRLGLTGHVHLEVELIKRRRLWFDRRVDHRDVDLTLTWSNDDQAYYLQGNRVVDLALIASERLSLRRQSEEPEDLQVEISARLEVVTEKSLDTVATWMTGGSHAGLPSNILKALANDLVRTGSGTCPIGQE